MRNIALFCAGLWLALLVGCTKSTDPLYGTGEEPDAAANESEGEAEAEAESESEAEAEGEPDVGTPDASRDAGLEADATTPTADAATVELDASPATPDATSPAPDAGVDASPLPDAGLDAEPDATPDLGPDAPLGCVSATEICNGADDNCDGNTDEGCPACTSDNVISNPGFESVVDDEWDLAGSDEAFTRDCTISQSGSCSARIEMSGTGGEVWLVQTLAIPAGSNELCLFARAISETEVSMEIVQGGPFRFRTITVGSDWTGDCASISTGASSVEIRFVIPNDVIRTVWIDTTYFGPTTCP